LAESSQAHEVGMEKMGDQRAYLEVKGKTKKSRRR